MDDNAVHRLCAGIVAKACKDYIKRRRKLYHTSYFSPEYAYNKAKVEELINFFNGSWYEVIMPSIDGTTLMNRLDDLAINGKRLEHGDKGDKYVCK